MGEEPLDPFLNF